MMIRIDINIWSLKHCSSNDRYLNIFNTNGNNQRQKSEDYQQDSHIMTTIKESENTKATYIKKIINRN